MGPPDFLTPVGVLRAIDKPVYDRQLMAQVRAARDTHAPDLNALYRQTETWAVPAPALDGVRCPSCDHPNLPGADECEDCLASLTHDEVTPAAARTRIERALYGDAVDKLEPSEAVCVLETATVEAAIGTLRDKRIGCVLVTETDGRLAGIFTERDVLERVATDEIDRGTAVLRDFMTPDPETIESDHLLAHAFHLMMVNDLRYLPVVDEKRRPTGVVSSRDPIDYIAELVMG